MSTPEQRLVDLDLELPPASPPKGVYRAVVVTNDIATTAGHLPIEFDAWGVDLLACSGHKGLMGPLGTGILCLSEAIAKELQPLRQGGTGSQSELDLQPDSLPDKFESGNHNAPGL